MIGADFEDKNKHVGFAYIKNTLRASNKTKWYGTGYADVHIESINSFVEYTHLFKSNFYATAGYSMHYTTVEGFTEQNSMYNVNIDKFEMGDLGLFGDVNYIANSRLGTTYFSLGLDYYTSLVNTKIYFADMLNYEFEDELLIGKLGILHSFGPFYISAEINSENLNSYQLGFTIKF